MKINRVEARYTVAPHACCITGRSDAELIDFGTEISGRVYMRESAFTEAALELGFVPKAKVAELISEMDGMKAELERLQGLFAALEAQEEAAKEVEERAEAILSD